jgi:hypothetical protein
VESAAKKALQDTSFLGSCQADRKLELKRMHDELFFEFVTVGIEEAQRTRSDRECWVPGQKLQGQSNLQVLHGLGQHTKPSLDHHTKPGFDQHTKPGLGQHTKPGLDQHTKLRLKAG